jgi:hypothetical protein
MTSVNWWYQINDDDIRIYKGKLHIATMAGNGQRMRDRAQQMAWRLNCGDAVEATPFMREMRRQQGYVRGKR